MHAAGFFVAIKLFMHILLVPGLDFLRQGGGLKKLQSGGSKTFDDGMQLFIGGRSIHMRQNTGLVNMRRRRRREGDLEILRRADIADVAQIRAPANGAAAIRDDRIKAKFLQMAFG